MEKWRKGWGRGGPRQIKEIVLGLEPTKTSLCRRDCGDLSDPLYLQDKSKDRDDSTLSGSTYFKTRVAVVGRLAVDEIRSGGSTSPKQLWNHSGYSDYFCLPKVIHLLTRTLIFTFAFVLFTRNDKHL